METLKFIASVIFLLIYIAGILLFLALFIQSQKEDDVDAGCFGGVLLFFLFGFIPFVCASLNVIFGLNL